LRRDDANKIALAHNARAGNILDRRVIDRKRLRARTEATLTAWQHDAAVHHAGQTDILKVFIPPGGLVRNVHARHARADKLELAWRLERRGAGHLGLERLLP